MKKETAWKDVYTTSNQGDIAIIKSLFEANKIRYFIENENFIRLPSTFRVDETQFKRAEDLLKDFREEDTPHLPI